MASKLDAILKEQTEQGKLLATIVANQTNFHERIFGKDNQKGALMFLQDEITAVDGKLTKEKDERIAADGELSKATGAIKSKLTLWTGMATGAGAVIGWALKVAGPKLASIFSAHP